MLRAKPPTAIKKRLKVFIYGAPKVGKTTCCIQFPKPYLIDTEGGAVHPQYVDLLKGSGGVIYQCTQADEVLKEVQALRREKHEFKTLIIDSITILYTNLLNYRDSVASGKFGEPYASTNRQFLALIYALMELDMNVLVTAHSKVKYVSTGTGNQLKMETEGETFDCYKKIPFLFDLIIEAQNRGGSRVGIVKGSRLTNFKEGESFVFNYESFCEKYDVNTMERATVPVKLASAEQLGEFSVLCIKLELSQDIKTKWLTKAKVEKFEEMKEVDLLGCIKYMKSKLGDK